MKQIFLFFVALACSLFAQTQDTVNYSADKVVYSRKDTVVYLIGNSKITYKTITMTADTIAYHSDKRIMIGAGHPLMIDGTDTLTGDYIAYNLKDKTGKVRQGVFNTKDELLYGGERIARGTDEALYIDNGSYTTSQAIDSTHYYFYGKNIKIIPNQKLYIKPFVLNIEDAPSAVFPLFIIPLERNRRNGFLAPRWGVGISGSGSVDNIGYYWAPNDYLDFTTAAKIDNFNSYIVKGETRYALKSKLSGSLYSDFLINKDYRSGSNRWSLRFNHNQYLLPDNSLTLKGRGDIVSDKSYHTDYSEDTTQLLNQNLSTDVSITKRLNKIGGYADIGWNRSQNLKRETVEQTLPSLRFTLNQRSIIPVSETKSDDEESEKWFNKFNWSYTARANQKLSSSDKIDSSYNRTFRGFSHSVPINAPFQILDYFTLTPNINLNHSVFDAYSDTTTRDTFFVHDTIFQKMAIKRTRDLDVIEDIALGKIIIFDTLFPPVVSDSTVRYNPVDTLVRKIQQDTTYWDDPAFVAKKANNFWWDAGASLSSRVYGLFPISIGSLTGVRHTFSPSISYRFTPEKELDVIFPSSVGISSTSGTKQRQDVSFSINNLFEARINRRGKENKIKLLTAGLSGGYNFEAESKKWSNFSLSGSIPNNYVDLSYSGSYTPYDSDTAMIFPQPLSHSLRVNPRLPQLSGSLWSGDFLTLEKVAHDSYMDGLAKTNKTGWSASISPRYNMSLNRSKIEDPFSQVRTYNLGGGFKFDFSHRWNMRWNGDWSFTEGTFINQSVSLYADLESWEMKFDWYPTGLNGGRFYFLVNIKKHRDIQWMKRKL